MCGKTCFRGRQTSNEVFGRIAALDKWNELFILFVISNEGNKFTI